MKDIKELCSVLRPPVVPQYGQGKLDWNYIENIMGTELPSDYKEFISVYGTGAIDNFIWVHDPLEDVEEYFNTINMKLWAYSETKRDYPEYYCHDVFPEKGGLLPVAVTDNGDEIYWITHGKPDFWSIVVYESRSEEHFEYNGSLIDFLYDLVTMKIKCSVFPEDFPSRVPVFSTPDEYRKYLEGMN